MNIIDFEIGGIKCDNPKCNFHDDNVKFEEYKDWLNKPCPKCESNLLTQADMDTVLRFQAIANTINKYLGWLGFFGGKVKRYNVEMKGTGKADFKEQD